MTHDNRPGVSSLLFYTHNVARALKPSVDGELAHAIHETLHFALDGEPQDYSVSRSVKSESPCAGQASTSAQSLEEEGGEEEIRAGFFATGDEERPYISYNWEQDEHRLVLPHPKTVANPTLIDPCTSVDQGTGVRDAFDVTAKFFFLEGAGGEAKEARYPVEWVDEALKRFDGATGLDSVDTLILAFGDKEGGSGLDVDRMATLWRQLSPNPRLLSMGLSDFSQPALQGLMEELGIGPDQASLTNTNPGRELDGGPKSSMTREVQEAAAKKTNGVVTDAKTATHVHIPSSPSKAAFAELAGGGATRAWKEYGPTPVNGNGNIKGSCCWDRGLADYCKESGILLVAHSDRKDILPARTLPTLMKEFQSKLPYQLPEGKRLLPLWCFKYTVLIRDRGVLADKGFLLYAEVVDA